MTTKTLNMKRLGIYLNDHLAGSTGGVELVKRMRGSNEGTPYAPVLERLEVEIAEDRDTLVEVMERLEISKDQIKVGLGWVAEKIGRLKLNDQLLGYSPLSRLIEFEALALGVTGKLALWRLLADVASDHPKLVDIDFVALAERAKRQQEELERSRVQAGREAMLEPE